MTGGPDCERWGNAANYSPAWAKRAAIAATLIPDGARVLEVGTGTGSFRGLVSQRCDYVGADLVPLDPSVCRVDLDNEPLPGDGFDFVVALGVIEYLHQPEAATRKMCHAAPSLVVSYCCRSAALSVEMAAEGRRTRKWVNSLTRDEFIALFTRHGHQLVSVTTLVETAEIDELLIVFRN
jgi:SAM-dependent methyltransferase